MWRAPQHAEKIGAQRLIMLGTNEWERGAVAVKDLSTFSQQEVPILQLTAPAAVAANLVVA